MPGFLDRHRASILMRERGLDALVLAQPESITYATGAFPGVATYWRRAGAAFVVVPADASVPLAAIVGDLQAKAFATQSGIADVRSHRIWVEAGSDPAAPVRTPRPAQFNLKHTVGLLREALGDRGLLNARVGLELGFIPAADYPAFTSLPVTWIDCTNVVERLRAIKAPAEIERLRNAAEYSRAGLLHLVKSVRPGMTAAEMTTVWKDAAIAESKQLGHAAPQSTWAYISVGGDGFAPGGPAADGDIIKVDVGCVVDGYSSDGARTLVLGKPSDEATRIFNALRRAFDVGFALLKPGARLADIYHATATTMWNAGYDTYGRGHFGHGVGSSIWSEEWPFIASTSDAVLEPGMVMAFETPWYIDGLGGFIIEDQLLITKSGCDVMAPLPRNLMRVG